MTKDLFGIGFDTLFSVLYKIMVSKVTFIGFKGEAITPTVELMCLGTHPEPSPDSGTYRG